MQQTDLNEKIELVLNELTLDEKIGMIHGAGLFQTAGVERLNIPPLRMSDGPMGVRCEFAQAEWKAVGESGDYVTYCPSNTAIAATWNRELARNAGTVLGEEARGRGKDIILGPGINIKRLPVCGRNFEYFSEDPYLISELVVPFIEGVESADVASCVKHFVLNNQETERLWVNVEIDERALREIYMPGFEAALKRANAKSVMGAYNLLRGEHCCQSIPLLKGILRDEWEYDGLVVSDWGAVHDTKKAAESPLDIEMSVYSNFDDYCMANPLRDAIMKGEISEEVVDEKIRNILRLMLRLKMIDIVSTATRSFVITENTDRSIGSYNTHEHRMRCLETAREAIILLKNDDNRLPLAPKKLKRLLVIGDNAVRLHANGGGSAEIKALYEISPLLGLKCALGGGCEVTYVPGYYVPDKEQSDKNWQEDSLNDQNPEEKRNLGYSEHERSMQEKLRNEAVALAAEYDDVIYVGGLNHDYDVEGYDRDTMELPYEQDTLITELLKVNPDMIIVMHAGNPVSMDKWMSDAKAVIWTGYYGMEAGTALAEIILGMVNPSGKLPESIPFSLDATSMNVLGECPGRPLTDDEKEHMNANLTETYNDGIFVGYRYYDKYNVPVLFCFGHGLSYTDFVYDNASAEWITNESGERCLSVSVDISNTGKYDGKETVQIYLGETVVSEENAVKELKGFEKIALRAGETRRVEIILEEKSFAHYDAENMCWQKKNGRYNVYVAASANDVKMTLEIEY